MTKEQQQQPPHSLAQTAEPLRIRDIYPVRWKSVQQNR